MFSAIISSNILLVSFFFLLLLLLLLLVMLILVLLMGSHESLRLCSFFYISFSFSFFPADLIISDYLALSLLVFFCLCKSVIKPVQRIFQFNYFNFHIWNFCLVLFKKKNNNKLLSLCRYFQVFYH